jgi:hypothetical protein
MLTPLAVAFAVLAVAPGRVATPPAQGQSGGEQDPTPKTDASVPASDVTMIGSSPAEASDETWGIGRHGGASVLVRYTAESGWSLGPQLLDSGGQPLSGFTLGHAEAKYSSPSPLAAQMTPGGAGALAGTVESRPAILVREPGGSFKETAAPPEEGEGAVLKPGESLYANNRPPMIAALEESGGGAGALVVPVDEGTGVDEAVLHWDGHGWTREAIEIPANSSEQFEVLAIGASSPDDAWLIARLSSQYPAGSVALFRRHVRGGGEATTWQPVTPKPGGEAGEPLRVEGELFTVASDDHAQILTVTGEGVWVDGQRHDVGASTTMFFKPEGEASGHVLAAWCLIPSNAPEGTQPCAHPLPQPLPMSPARSFAWANGNEGLGERVITGLPDGVSLSLNGAEFTEVLGLGGEAGAELGAAFSTAKEGWLGKVGLPVHLTSDPGASANRLTPWPVAFRHALLALAPQPGVPVGSLSSQALAVGDEGEIARYEPGEGWLPESLLGPGGRRETPRLRAVAWPTPSRAYAVGDLGQMWLWRGETALWEPDPAIPANFRGNLLGIAFEPGSQSRGYAVGSQGTLLQYGKTWTQEPEEAIPPPARGASFTSIAFSGSQAIVAYRKLISADSESYVGGLIVNEGSGWHVEEGAAAAMGSSVPWAVAGLADGGAAFTASGSGTGVKVYERQGEGAGWQATPTPFPGANAPATLALFREGGALRAITAGSQPDTYHNVENEPSPPPGSPPNLIPPYPLAANPENGVLRQTANGWSDEEHELNNAKEPPGHYAHFDTVYEPDPVAAVLVDPTGSQGWAVGGVVNGQHPQLETADAYRYPADGVAPVGVGSAPLSANSTTFAIGGGAQCAAPCAARAATKIGPDVWLSAALERAKGVSGVQAFLYTGPRVTSGETAGPATLVIPYERELARYAAILAASNPMPAFLAASPTDLDGAESERLFEQSFSFPAPFGQPACTSPGCESAYYSLSSGGVRVLVLDDSAHEEVLENELKWLEAEVGAAAGASEPAIVVAHADLPVQVEARDPSAEAVARAIVGEAGRPGASAYFFDDPEKNVKLQLASGGGAIPSFGSGTLGYVNSVAEEAGKGFIGASGFLLAQVHVAERNPETNVAPVTSRLIPNVGELAMEAKDGTLLRRSQAALFDGLARRPRSGNRAHNQSEGFETSPYIPVPSNCVGVECASGLFPEYSFSSSNTQIGDFVKPNLATGNPRAVELGPDGKPIHDPESGLFCAYNPGTTTVTISAGGLSYSLPVTVQAGSVREPCGTTPVTGLLVPQEATPPVPAPAPAPTPASAPPSSAPPLLPVPPAPLPLAASPAPPAVVHPAAPAPPGFFTQAALPAFVPPFLPPPLPTPARPTPPSGTSAVTSPVEAAEREEEEEAAPESVSNEAVAYRAPEHEPSPVYILGIVVLAAFAGATMRGRPGRRRRRELRVAPATISAMRAQRRMARRRDVW